MAHSTGKIAVSADTPVQITGDGPAEDMAITRGRTSSVRFAFIPDTTAVVQIGSEAAILGDTGFVFFADSETGVVESFDLVAEEELWLTSTGAGELRWFRS